MNKCIKVRILKPADPDMSWKDLGDLLHDLSYKAYRITNFVLLQEYLYAMKEEHNPEYLNDKGSSTCIRPLPVPIRNSAPM